MSTFKPLIAPEVFALRPDFRALSIRARGVVNSAGTPEAAAALASACRAPCAEPWAEVHISAWRDAYRAFGAKPQRTPCSAEALRKRVDRGGVLPCINAVVDRYNAVSLRYAIPVGGENVAGYVGFPRLMRAAGSELFETMQSGSPSIETPEPGEVVWGDERGVTCRRWNWRQGTRTRVEVTTTDMWFVLEALDPMPNTALMKAGAELLLGLRTLSPKSELETLLIDKNGARNLSLCDFS